MSVPSGAANGMFMSQIPQQVTPSVGAPLAAQAVPAAAQATVVAVVVVVVVVVVVGGAVAHTPS